MTRMNDEIWIEREEGNTGGISEEWNKVGE